MKQPTFQEIKHILQQLIDGTMSREEASGLAYTFLKFDQTHHIQVHDPNLWHLLTAVSCCAELIAPDVYLYDKEDFRAWLDDYLKKSSSSENF